MLTDIHRNTAAFTSTTLHAAAPRPEARPVLQPGVAPLAAMIPSRDIIDPVPTGTESHFDRDSGGEEE